MKPSIWTDAFVELEAEEAVERMAALGWTTLELAEVHWRGLAKSLWLGIAVENLCDQHRLPYEGTVNWDGALRALNEIDYPGAFNLEIGGSLHTTLLVIRPAKIRYAHALAERQMSSSR